MVLMRSRRWRQMVVDTFSMLLENVWIADWVVLVFVGSTSSAQELYNNCVSCSLVDLFLTVQAIEGRWCGDHGIVYK